MATFAVGDIQGCLDELKRLLERIGFDPADDLLWFTGDLVNRGPRSLETLRFVKRLGERAVCVLGNHDLHLLAVAEHKDKRRKSDTLDEVLEAPDRDELLHWLRHRPLLHHDAALGYTLIHAGLPPQWDLKTATACARELEAVLRGPDYAEFFEHMYGDKPRRWSPELEGF
ncbi:MAG: symmetrical bis(5'-nucleosyl)-tetraphosphatase, partial [Bacillota bacterium]